MSKARLIKRLEWYYPTERFHTYITFPFLLIATVIAYPLKEIILCIYGLIICIFILYQGQQYWKLKLDSLKGIQIEQDRYLQFFRTAKQRNLVLIALIPISILIQLYLIQWDFTNKYFLWGLVAAAVAIGEHINYYHTQLMIDNKYDIAYIKKNKRLKKASLAKDLQENRL